MTVQLSPAGVKPRSRWMAGIATVTMLPSRIVISIAADSTVSAARATGTCRCGAVEESRRVRHGRLLFGRERVQGEQE
ncbi:hypothetical protein ACFQX6_42055 [Streptosporangium lutulentum]